MVRNTKSASYRRKLAQRLIARVARPGVPSDRFWASFWKDVACEETFARDLHFESADALRSALDRMHRIADLRNELPRIPEFVAKQMAKLLPAKERKNWPAEIDRTMGFPAIGVGRPSNRIVRKELLLSISCLEFITLTDVSPQVWALMEDKDLEAWERALELPIANSRPAKIERIKKGWPANRKIRQSVRKQLEMYARHILLDYEPTDLEQRKGLATMTLQDVADLGGLGEPPKVPKEGEKAVRPGLWKKVRTPRIS